jgi:sodium/bile acid cotransporter 7
MRLISKKTSIIIWLKRYWFLVALFAICLITLADSVGVLADAGRWLKGHHGPDLVVVFIFLFSGFALSPEQLKDGLGDGAGILLACAVIFVAAPLIAMLFSRIPVETGIVIGLFLVSVMPSTLSSGVVMTAAAGGSAAHALVITIVANTLSVFTIPYALSFLLRTIGQSATITIDKAGIMLKIGILVILPLAVGMLLKHFLAPVYRRVAHKLTVANQCLILSIVWIAMSQTRAMLMESGFTVAVIVMIVFVYHGLLLITGWLLIRSTGRERGRRESLLFMGAQKTLPLSVILQMSLFPQYGMALLVCVLHHIVHLMTDGYLVERLRNR